MNQGYNNIEFPSTQQRPYVQSQRQQPQQQQQAAMRIIPIQVEGARSPQNENTIVLQR